MMLDVRYHRDFRCYFLYLPGQPAEDGSPQWYATPLSAEEALLWQYGDKAELTRRLRERLGAALGFDVPREVWYRRVWRWLGRALLR